MSTDNIEILETEVTEIPDEAPTENIEPEVTEIPDEAPTENIDLSSRECTLELEEELSVYMNQLNLSQLIVMDRIKAECATPIIRFMNDKFTIMDGDKVFLQADWHFIGEFHTEKENPAIKGYEFVWSWALREDAETDSHVKDVARVTESLPYGLQPLTFPLVQFEDVGLLEVIKAYSFVELGLEFMHVMYNEALKTYGVFGMYNIEYSEKKKTSNMLDTIVKQAKKKAGELRKANPEMDGADAIKQAWQTPEILSLVAQYQRDKQNKQKTSDEFKNFFKRAIMDPSLVLDNPDIVDNGEKVQVVDDKYVNALNAVERALDQVREEELGELEQVGDDLE